MRRISLLAAVGVCLTLSACGGGGGGGGIRTVTVPTAGTPRAAQQLGIPVIATKNTTRVAGGDAIADAAGVARAVYPAAASGTHPTAVTIAPTDDWQGAIASAVLMSAPIKAPILLSGSSSLPPATLDALTTLAPGGSRAIGGAQVIRVGDVPRLADVHAASITGGDPYQLAAAIDRYVSVAAGQPSGDVVIASGSNDDAQYAMPAAGWAAESGDPILFVSHSNIPQATRQALRAHSKPRIYVLGPPSAISADVVTQLRKYGTVKRVGASDPAANAVAFTTYRDPPCPVNQPCAHVPGSFGWAMRSPGHGYVLINSKRTLDAAAAAALSASGSYGPQLLVDQASELPRPVLNFFLDYATPGFTQEGPTAAVYNHGWVMGDEAAISVGVQAQMDNLLEAVPQK
jgi:ell wall binding domain 2 (CWB2)